MTHEDALLTEAVHAASADIDRLDSRAIVALMNDEDAQVVDAVRAVADSIAKVIDLVADRFQRGGRLIYIGAGTSGRLGVLDASECPPSFSTPPSMVVGLIAGGRDALTNAIEGAEDDRQQGEADIDSAQVGPGDVVLGIATSGRTPYVLAAVDRARVRGASTVGLACNAPSRLAEHVDLMIAPLVGPEILAGSTRLKSGTATKMILNMITTGSMIRIGKTYGNRMVDLHPSNEKLRLRSRRMLRDIGGIDDHEAVRLLALTGGDLKPALVMAMTGVTAQEARCRLEAANGHLRVAIS